MEREDDKDVLVQVGVGRNLLAGSGSFVMRRDECGREPRQWRVSCELVPAHNFVVKTHTKTETGWVDF